MVNTFKCLILGYAIRVLSPAVMIIGIFATIIFNLGILYEYAYGQDDISNTSIVKSNNMSTVDQIRLDVSTNPNFTFFNETTALPSDWQDPFHTCNKYFSCTIKFTDGWNDYVSFSLSTSNNTNSTWSSIYGKPIDVESRQKYQLVTHMKLNKWAIKSHVGLEGFNQSSNQWNQISQCPPGLSGPLDWHEFNCTITIPGKISKIRAVLNAGWSSDSNQEATTWFDSINILGNERAAAG